MARNRISEYKAKQLLYPLLKLPFEAAQVTSEKNDISSLSSKKAYVLKVDQGVKQRMKKGLIKVGVKKTEMEKAVKELSAKGYTNFFIEEMVTYDKEKEAFISFEQTREGIQVYYSKQGGIHVEEHANAMLKDVLTETSKKEVTKYLNLPTGFLDAVETMFTKYFVTFLEINPLVIDKKNLFIIDLAVEVDSAGEFFVEGAWHAKDFVQTSTYKTKEEEVVDKLARESQASLKLDVLNKDGSIFLLLSGGGASLVLADEVYNLGSGKELANYGEYSGNPNAEETYVYTKNLLSILLKSKATKKVLIIGGGVANFTDIRSTFKGVIRALDELKIPLYDQGVKVFVRRGGPHQKEGLFQMKHFLEKNNLLGQVHGPEVLLTEVVQEGLQSIQ